MLGGGGADGGAAVWAAAGRSPPVRLATSASRSSMCRATARTATAEGSDSITDSYPRYGCVHGAR